MRGETKNCTKNNVLFPQRKELPPCIASKGLAIVLFFFSLCGSAKFGRKVMYVDYLNDLQQHLPLSQLPIPPRVQQWVTSPFHVCLCLCVPSPCFRLLLYVCVIILFTVWICLPYCLYICCFLSFCLCFSLCVLSPLPVSVSVFVLFTSLLSHLYPSSLPPSSHCLTSPHLSHRHDQQLLAKLKNVPKAPGGRSHKPLPTQQFGVSLQYIKEANRQDPIPPVLKTCITFLDHPDGV